MRKCAWNAYHNAWPSINLQPPLLSPNPAFSFISANICRIKKIEASWLKSLLLNSSFSWVPSTCLHSHLHCNPLGILQKIITIRKAPHRETITANLANLTRMSAERKIASWIMILKQRVVYQDARLQASMWNNLSTHSSLNTQLFSSVPLPFSNEVALNRMSWDKIMSLQFTVHLNLRLLTHSPNHTNLTSPCLLTSTRIRINLQETFECGSSMWGYSEIRWLFIPL